MPYKAFVQCRHRISVCVPYMFAYYLSYLLFILFYGPLLPDSKNKMELNKHERIWAKKNNN